MFETALERRTRSSGRSAFRSRRHAGYAKFKSLRHRVSRWLAPSSRVSDAPYASRLPEPDRWFFDPGHRGCTGGQFFTRCAGADFDCAVRVEFRHPCRQRVSRPSGGGDGLAGPSGRPSATSRVDAVTGEAVHNEAAVGRGDGKLDSAASGAWAAPRLLPFRRRTQGG